MSAGIVQKQRGEGRNLFCFELEFPDGFPGGSVVKNPPVMQETWVQCLGQNDSLEEEMATHPGKSRVQRSLAGYSPWGRKGSDMTE